MWTSILKRLKKKPTSSPKPKQWFEIYQSYACLTESQKIFLSYYTEESFNAILGIDYILNMRYRMYLNEFVEAVDHFINTGEKVYPYKHAQDKQDLRKQNEALRMLVSELMKEKQNESNRNAKAL